MAHLLIVDDEDGICWGFSKLGADMGHTVATAASAEEGLKLAAEARPDALVLDVRLPGMDGLEAMQHFRRQFGSVPIIVITAYGELPIAVTAVRSGAFDYLIKPFDLAVAERAIRRALQSAPALPPEASAPSAPDEDRLVGMSSAMQEVFKRTALVADSDACVHLRGESGTGKELVARAIHRYSRRSAEPFVPVNVASLSPTLAESELFGHMRGSFTGADQSRKGILEQAHGGTIFLDEVADIPMSIQVKLLRALERGEVLPVGAGSPVFADFRIISATHQNLPQRVAEGSFRHDLYYRLITFDIEIPPLRERREDVRPLTEHFLALLAARDDRPAPSISDDALEELHRRPWYGNVRELRNAIEHAMVLARTGTITADLLPPPLPTSALAASVQEDALGRLVRHWTETRLLAPDEPAELYEGLLQVVEPPFLKAVMQHFRGQCATAAKRVGLHRTTLRKKLDQFGINEE